MVQNYMTSLFHISKKWLFALLFLASVQSSFSVTIPGGGPTGSSQRKPLGVFFGYERSQMRYTNAELGSPGPSFITSIYFYLNSAPPLSVCLSAGGCGGSGPCMNPFPYNIYM